MRKKTKNLNVTESLNLNELHKTAHKSFDVIVIIVVVMLTQLFICKNNNNNIIILFIP